MISSRPVVLNGDAPSRATFSRTPGRTLLKENSIQGATTVNGKGKRVALQTPFHPTTLQPQRLFKGPQQKPSITIAPSRPFLDKTPFPNRVGPVPTSSSKLGRLILRTPDPHKTPDNLLRPSSTRTHIRVPRSASRSFETPVNHGNPWDVSELSIVLPDSQVETIGENGEDDHDEIEYMPPTVDIPYQPPFDFEMPDYKIAGRMLRELSQSYVPDDSPIEIDFEIDENDPGFMGWESLPLPNLEDDDPFSQAVKNDAGSRVPLGSNKRIAVTKHSALSKREVPVPVPAVASRVHKLSTASVAKMRTPLGVRPVSSAAPAPSRTSRRPGTTGIARPTTAVPTSTATTRSGPSVPVKVAGKTSRSTIAVSTTTVSSMSRAQDALAKLSVRRPTTSASVYTHDTKPPLVPRAHRMRGVLNRVKAAKRDDGFTGLVFNAVHDSGEDFKFNV